MQVIPIIIELYYQNLPFLRTLKELSDNFALKNFVAFKL